MTNYYFLWYSDEYKDYPDIPHVEKFVHDFGSNLLLSMETNTATSGLVRKFATDK